MSNAVALHHARPEGMGGGARREEEYAAAAFIWDYFDDFSAEVRAGILGNIMTEAGGQTLDIQPYIGTDYYGICQWGPHYPEIQGANLERQCEFLKDTIEEEINMFGSPYRQGFNYEQFLQLNNPASVALAFAICYERCSPAGYTKRQQNAMIAYEYFVGSGRAGFER